MRLRDGVLISYLRGERERDCKGHIWGVLGVFGFLLGGCIDIAWRRECEERHWRFLTSMSLGERP